MTGGVLRVGGPLGNRVAIPVEQGQRFRLPGPGQRVPRILASGRPEGSESPRQPVRRRVIEPLKTQSAGPIGLDVRRGRRSWKSDAVMRRQTSAWISTNPWGLNTRSYRSAHR